jgi:hypothetical protein
VLLINDLELNKQIKKINKIAKEKNAVLQARTNRKLKIKVKKTVIKESNENSKYDEL